MALPPPPPAAIRAAGPTSPSKGCLTAAIVARVFIGLANHPIACPKPPMPQRAGEIVHCERFEVVNLTR